MDPFFSSRFLIPYVKVASASAFQTADGNPLMSLEVNLVETQLVLPFKRTEYRKKKYNRKL